MIKNRISFLSVIFILALIVIISLFLIFSDTFNIKNIEIIGLNRLSKDHISNILELNGNDTNILMYNSSSMGDRLLKENAYIDKVEIKKVLPNSLIVSISERKLIAYIEFMQDYFLYIDDKCRVIEINNILKEPLPIIVGLNLEGFSLGKPLYEEDLPFWDTVITLSNLFSNYPITDKFVYINVSNEDDIHIFIDKIDVWFGNIYNSYEKILRLQGIMETLADKNLSGYLDIRDIDQPPVFTQVS